MPEESEQPQSPRSKSGGGPSPKIRIKGPADKPDIKIRKVSDAEDEKPPEPEPQPPKPPEEKKKATVRINLPGAKPSAPAATPPADNPPQQKKPLKIRIDQGESARKPSGPQPETAGLPQSVRIRGPKGDSQQIELGAEPTAAIEDAAADKQARPGPPMPARGDAAKTAVPSKGSEAALGKAPSEVKPPQTKTSARLVKPQAAAGATHERAPSYAGGVSVKKKRKDAGPVVSTFSVLAAVVGLAVVYLLLAQALPDLGLPVPRLF